MILLVDDHRDVRFMLSLFLEDEGVDFEQATSGEEALDFVEQRSYDLILLDQRMPPGMSGIEVAERLRDQGDRTPIVLYSAYLEPGVQERAEEMGLRTVDKGAADQLMGEVRALVPAA